MSEHKMISIADQVFDELERDILSGKYERGAVMTENKFSELLGVSRTPVREALKRLSQEHLIELTSKGARVVGISGEDLEDIFEIRYRLEGLAARYAALRADEKGVEALRETLDLQEFFTLKGDAESLKNTDTRFHQTIYALSRSHTIYDALEPLHRKLLKYRRLSLTTHERAEQSLIEHRDIFAAIADGNGDKAEALTILHVEKARDSIMRGRELA